MGKKGKKKHRRPKGPRVHHHGKERIAVTVSVPDNRVEALKRFAARLSRRHPAQRDEVIYQIRQHRRELERFGIARLSLFGSVARNMSTHDSDVDLLVEFEPGRPAGLFEFVELQNLLAAIVGRPVDLITASRVKARLKKRIARECIRVL